MKRLLYPALLLAACGFMLWTHLEMISNIRSSWPLAAIFSTGAFTYVAFLRTDAATGKIPAGISESQLQLIISASFFALGVAAALNHWPASAGPMILLVVFDGAFALAALAKAYDMLWPLGAADIKDVREDAGLSREREG